MTDRKRFPTPRCHADGCEALDFDDWCDTLRAEVRKTLSDRVVLEEPPMDPLAVPVEGACHVGLTLTSKGYAQIKVGRTRRGCRAALAAMGIRLGQWHVDHLCRNRACVNPAHLELVDRAENTARGRSFAPVNALKTHCPNGHPYDGDNLYVSPSGRRNCRACRVVWRRKYSATSGEVGQ